MAGLASGADAAYIYEEPFNIHDLEVSLWVFLRTDKYDEGQQKHLSGRDVLIFVKLADLYVVECGTFGGEDENYSEEGTHSEV